MPGTIKTFGNTVTVEHAGADTTTVIDPESVGLSEVVVVDRLAVRLDGVGGCEVRDSAGNTFEKIYAGAFGVEGSDGAKIHLPLAFGLVFETDGAGFLILEYHKE